MKKGKKSAKDMLDIFDQCEGFFGSKTKDFTSVIDALELLLTQMKITRQVSEETKKELKNYTDEEFTKEAMKRLAPRLKPTLKKLREVHDSGVNLKLFSLPDKKGKRFFEIMAELEEIGKLPMGDKTKRCKIYNVINSLEQYILEIKEINKPFIPVKVDPDQTIIFKVMFRRRKGMWRKIELKAKDTLEDLHDAIQDAFDWDNDHLYSFFMDGKFRNGDPDMEYTCPFEPEGRKTVDKAKLGFFGFKTGDKFAYLFDFGDCHEFEIEVVGFGIVEKDKDYPLVIESKGKSLEQYPEYDEE